MQQCSTEVKQGDLTLRVQTPQCVGVDDAHIEQPPGEGRPVLTTSPMHRIILTKLINCVHMALAFIVVQHHLRLSHLRRKVWASVLFEGDHVIDPMMGAEHQYWPLVTPR